MNLNNINKEESDKILEGFLSELLSKQEPLGEEFSKVLYDNLWNLYES